MEQSMPPNGSNHEKPANGIARNDSDFSALPMIIAEQLDEQPNYVCARVLYWIHWLFSSPEEDITVGSQSEELVEGKRHVHISLDNLERCCEEIVKEMGFGINHTTKTLKIEAEQFDALRMAWLKQYRKFLEYQDSIDCCISPMIRKIKIQFYQFCLSFYRLDDKNHEMADILMKILHEEEKINPYVLDNETLKLGNSIGLLACTLSGILLPLPEPSGDLDSPKSSFSVSQSGESNDKVTHSPSRKRENSTVKTTRSKSSSEPLKWSLLFGEKLKEEFDKIQDNARAVFHREQAIKRQNDFLNYLADSSGLAYNHSEAKKELRKFVLKYRSRIGIYPFFKGLKIVFREQQKRPLVLRWISSPEIFTENGEDFMKDAVHLLHVLDFRPQAKLVGVTEEELSNITDKKSENNEIPLDASTESEEEKETTKKETQGVAEETGDDKNTGTRILRSSIPAVRRLESFLMDEEDEQETNPPKNNQEFQIDSVSFLVGGLTNKQLDSLVAMLPRSKKLGKGTLAGKWQETTLDRKVT